MDFHEILQQHWPKLGFEVKLLSRRLRLETVLFIFLFTYTIQVHSKVAKIEKNKSS